MGKGCEQGIQRKGDRKSSDTQKRLELTRMLSI